jgi:hypothetical protein
MKKTITFILMLALFGLSSAFAQLSERENDSITVKLGARPVAGDMSLVFSYPVVSDTGNHFKGNLLRTGDCITFKRYLTDDVAIRAGLRLYKSSSHSKGDIADSSGLIPPNIIESNEFKSSKREYDIVPGIEKHFSKGNIFDTYAGADLYLGLGRDVTIQDVKYKSNDFTNMTAITNTTIFGFGAVVGFNIFIAHLPVSLGLEYGLTAKWTKGGKTKVTEDDQIGGTAYSATYYTEDTNGLGTPDPNLYKKLKKGEFSMDTNQDVKIVLNIYFGK